MSRSEDWDVLVDSFFWRDPDEVLAENAEENKWEDAAASGGVVAPGSGAADWEGAGAAVEWEGNGDDWGAPAAGAEGW